MNFSNRFHKSFITSMILIFLLSGVIAAYADVSSEYWEKDFQNNLISIKSINGEFYAYIVLLFTENPHYVNLIQQDRITSEMMQKDGYHINEYKRYLESLKNVNFKKQAETMLNVFLNPEKYDEAALEKIQDDLAKFNIIVKFSKAKNSGIDKITLDYWIYGRKEPINIVHPLFDIKEKIFNIQPFIYSDEFFTSNSTFYSDMIYINPYEVHNDYLIAENLINGKNVEHMLFNGARINNNIKYCILQAFKKPENIKKEILNLFIVHEMTHKILNNHYNYYDMVAGEELALSSTIYLNPYLGLAVLYSYLDYDKITPHAIAAMNVVKYFANKTGKPGMIDDPAGVKLLAAKDIKQLIKEHFSLIVKNIKQ